MKRLSLFALAFVTSMVVMAQDKPARTETEVRPRFGVKAGVNLATFEIDDDSQTNDVNTNNKTSFHGGVFVNIPLAERFAIQPELVWSGQGSKLSTRVLSQTVNTEWDFHYLNVPIMLQAKVGGAGPFVELGPQIGFLLSAKDEDDNNLKDQINLKTLDIGAGFGIGYVSRVGLGLNARYNLGFSNIYDDDAAGDEGKLKNRTVQIGLVYHFGANQ